MTADTHSAVHTLIAARALVAARNRRRPTSPAELAAMLDPTFVVTPTIRLLSDELVRAVETPDARLIVTTPPRTGKSTLVSRVFPVWLLMRDPDAEVILKSYGDTLAEEHSAAARRMIAEHRDLLGIELAQDKTSVGRWRVQGRRGGVLAGGILSGTTGFGANYLIVDDPVKGAQEADSEAYRRRLISEFRASLMTRLMPGGSAIVVLPAGTKTTSPENCWPNPTAAGAWSTSPPSPPVECPMRWIATPVPPSPAPTASPWNGSPRYAPKSAPANGPRSTSADPPAPRAG